MRRTHRLSSAVCILIAFWAHFPPAAATDPVPEALGVSLKKQGYTAIPLTPALDSGFFLLRVTLDEKPFTLLLDTGASYPFTLNKASGKALGIASDTYTWETAPATPAIRSLKYGVGTVEGVTLGGGFTVKGRHRVHVVDGLVADPVRVHNSKTNEDEESRIDGLLGQGFLTQNSAVIDHDTATLYVIPPHLKDGPKWIGRWECSGGEKDGKPHDDLKQNWIDVRADGLEICLGGESATGVLELLRDSRWKLVLVRSAELDPAKATVYVRGIYDFSDNRLRLCVPDEAVNAKEKRLEGGRLPGVFEAKKGSGHVYYEFKRVKAEKK